MVVALSKRLLKHLPACGIRGGDGAVDQGMGASRCPCEGDNSSQGGDVVASVHKRDCN